MVSITLSVPESLKQEMEQFPEMNWSAVARETIKRKIILLKKFKKFTKQSTFTEREALELGKKVNKVVARRYKRK